MVRKDMSFIFTRSCACMDCLTIYPFYDCVTSSNSAHSTTAKVLRSTEYVHRLSVWSVKWRLRQCVVLLILAQVLRSKFLQFLLFCPSNVYAPGLDSLFVLQCNFRKREMPNRWILFLYWQAFQIRSFYLLFGKLVQCYWHLSSDLISIDCFIQF